MILKWRRRSLPALIFWLSTWTLCMVCGVKTKTRITARHMGMCKGEKPLTSKRDAKILSWMIEVSSENLILLKSSPQHQAACWILHKDRSKSRRRSHAKLLQRYALVVLHFSTTQSGKKVWDWPIAADDPTAEKTNGKWMSQKHHECSWYGIQCGFRKNVVLLDLGYLKLDGLLPRELGLLTRLSDIDLHGNDCKCHIGTRERPEEAHHVPFSTRCGTI